jgi:hypothetical protein
MKQIKRRRLSAAVWRGLLAKFAGSDLTVQAFCAQEGISRSSLNLWRSRLADLDPAPAGKPTTATAVADFVELGTLGERRSPPERFELRLDLGGGLTLHLVRG